MKTKNCIMCDIGASNGRVLIGSYNNGKLKTKGVYRFDNIPVNVNGTIYWDILRLYSEVKIGIKKALSIEKDINSIGVDTWGVDFALLDRIGKMINNPVHYRDNARFNAAKELSNVISPKKLFEYTGGLVIPIMSIYHIYSLIIDKAPEIEHANQFLMIPELINYFLTGEKINEYTNSTLSLLFDIKTKEWSKKILKTLKISPSIFKEVMYPGYSIKKLSTNVTKELDIKPLNVILTATHDTASAEAGIPVIEKSKNWAFLSIGTWAIVGMETAKPIISEKVFTAGFGNEGSADGKSYLAKNITGLWIIQQCKNFWEQNEHKKLSWDEIVKLSSKAKHFKAIIDVDNPLFTKLQANMPKTINNFLEKSGQNLLNDIGEFSRCIYESLVFKIYYNLKQLESLSEKNIEILHIVGGGSKNKLLCQWLSNILGIPVIAGPAETTSLGNFITQLVALKEINNIREGRKIIHSSSNLQYYAPYNTDVWRNRYMTNLHIIESA